MDVGLDTGDIIAKKQVRIAEDETGGSLFDKLAGSRRRAVCGNHADAGKQNGDLYTAGQ